MRAVRPIVRQFKARFVREIGEHVRAGGHAVVWDNPRRARLVLPLPDEANQQDLALWSLLDLGKSKFERIARGPLRGLATSLVPRDCLEIVRHRAERDSIFEGSTREVDFDCLACGACCKDNEVELWPVDIARLKAGGRADITRPPFTKRKDGKLMLRLLRNKSCKQLLPDNKCAIYELRPDSCSTFPVASEPCLFSREDGLGLIDGYDG